MRTSEYYGVQVPELGDRADITVVSNAIVDGENNQSGKIENMKATLNSSTIELTSECRTDKLVKYYNGLAVQFISPVNADAGTSYKIKIDNLAEQPYNNQVEIKVGDIVNAIYGSTGFVTASSPMHNDVARKSTQIIAGNGLTGGGDLSENRTINVASADDSIIVGADNIKVNTYNGVDSSNVTRPASAAAVKAAYDKGLEGLNKANTKLDAGSVSTEYNTAKKIEDKIKELDSTKQNKTDNGLTTSNKTVVGAINESLPWNNDQKYSKHYYHNLWDDDSINKAVYEHLYPVEFARNPDAHRGIVSRKELRLWTGEGASNPMGRYLLELNGKLSYMSSGICYIFYNQNNIGNIKELWVNSSNALIRNQNIVLSEAWSNFQTIIIEVCNYIGVNVDYTQIMLETSLLRTNNAATADNQENDYILSFFGNHSYKTVYFRDDRRTIYFGEARYNDSPSNNIRIKRIIGVNRKVGAIQ